MFQAEKNISGKRETLSSGIRSDRRRPETVPSELTPKATKIASMFMQDIAADGGGRVARVIRYLNHFYTSDAHYL